jgi:predicted methyltransferase
MNLTYLNKRIVIELFKGSEGLYLFTLYQRLKATPKDLFNAINELIQEKIISKQGDRINLTSDGKEFVIKHKITVKGNSDKFQKISSNFLGRKISVNEFYLPSSPNIQNELLTNNDFRGPIKTSTNGSEVAS